MLTLTGINIELLIVEWVQLTPNTWYYPAVQDTYWRFYLCHNEGGQVEFADRCVRLQPGDGYFLPAGVRFTTRATQPFFQFYTHFDVQGMPRQAMQLLFNELITLPSFAEKQQLRSPSLPLGNIAAPIIEECRVKAMLYNALVEYLTVLPPDILTAAFHPEPLLPALLPALNYLEQHLPAPISIPLLAELCCLHPDYFTRRFRICTGYSPVSYIQQQRVKLAAKLLVTSLQSIDSIAESTGFGNRAYFTRIFTRFTGQPPAQYRKMRGKS